MKKREGMMGIRGGGGGGGGWGDGKGPEWGGAGVGWSGWGEALSLLKNAPKSFTKLKDR